MEVEKETQPIRQNDQNLSDQPPNLPQGGKRKVNGVIIILVVVIAVLAGAAYHFATQKPDTSGNLKIDPNVILDADKAKEAAEEAKIPATSINISMLKTIRFSDGQSKGTIALENTTMNQYPYKVTISDQGSGDLLYESGLIPVGATLEEITLLKDLDAGEYAGVAMFTTYDENNEAVGRVGVTVNIIVDN